MTARAMQGMINQQSAEVYIINNPWDWDPLKECGKPYEELPRLTGTDAGLRTLFRKYQGRVSKMCIYDPEKDWTWYLALMSASQQEGIPVTKSQQENLTSEFGWKGGVEDFRDRWSNRTEAYDWALVNLMPHCTKQVVFALQQSPSLTDYATASKGFVFWLDFDAERAEVQKIFRTRGYGVGTSLMGYANTGDEGNAVANPFGIGYVVSELYANGSFWSSFPNKTYTQSAGKAVKAEPGKIYAHIKWSDGDNLEFDQNPLYKFWHDPARGTIPVATELAPALQELNSPLLDWYYSKMTDNDELVSGAAGVQFIFIDHYNGALFPAWCRLSRTWCAGAGFHACRIWSAPIPSVKYSTYMAGCGFDGVFGEGWRIRAGFPPEVDTWGADNEEDLFNQIIKIKPDPQRPVFCGFTCIVGGFYQGDHGYTAIKRVLDRVQAAYPGRYIFLLPKDEFATIRAYYNTSKGKVIGLPDNDQGLTPVAVGDGEFQKVDHAGIPCWLVPKKSPAGYFYFRVADDFRPSPGKILEIDLSYFDSGTGDIGLDYDSTDFRWVNGGDYKTDPDAIHRNDSGQWKVASFFVNDAAFGHLENGGADFRFYNGGDDLLVRAVQVQRNIRP